jgi:cytochrome c oxidase assembly factor CtaG
MVQKNWVAAALALSLFLLSFIICWAIAIPDNFSQHCPAYIQINLP